MVQYQYPKLRTTQVNTEIANSITVKILRSSNDPEPMKIIEVPRARAMIGGTGDSLEAE